jgi:NAD dependent epimerase/dehydratase
VNLKDRSVLVTGAGGFIGSHLVEALIARGCQVRAFVRYTSTGTCGWIDSLREENRQQIKIIAGDLRDNDAVRDVVKGCDVVFHLGALIGIPYSYIHPREYVDTNIVGTTNVLVGCREHQVARVVVVSTSEVYGTAQYAPIDEKHPQVGQSPYAASKIAADMLAESFYRSFGLPVTIIRPFNTYGPRQSQRAIVPTIVLQLLRSETIALGATSPTRDLTYVTDTVAGIIRGAEVDDVVGMTINLGSGDEISVGRLAEQIAALLGRNLKIKRDADRVRPEGSEVARLVSNNSLAQQVLLWRPLTSLEQGLRQTIDWFRVDQAGIRSDYVV